MKEFKLKIGRINASISDIVILEIETPIDDFNHNEIAEIIAMLKNKDIKIFDLDYKYKVIKDTLSVGRNNPIHSCSNYERFLSFCLFPLELKEITDFQKWIDGFNGKELEVNL